MQKVIQTNFDHTHLNTNHTAPDMTKTFSKLQDKLASSAPHIVHRGRKTQHIIEDLSDKGLAMMEKAMCGEITANEEGVQEEKAEHQDVLVELL